MPGFLDPTASISRGSIYSKSFETDGALWLPFPGGAGSVFTFVGTFTTARNAQGDYTLNLTAAANSPFVVVDLDQCFEKIGADPINTALAGSNYPAGTTNFPTPVLLGTETLATDSDVHLVRGFKLMGYDVVYTLGTAALTTHTGTVLSSSLATSAAGATVTVKDAAQALGTTTSANVKITHINLVTPYVIGLNASVAGGPDLADFLEIAIVNPGTSVLKYYGVRLYYNYCIL